jgi:hypothetical protein
VALSAPERQALTGIVDRCRTLLESDARDQLERLYGFTREGRPRPLDGLGLRSLELGIAESLREWHRHLTGLATGTEAERERAALRRMAEETAFTVLHRLAAIRMAEERGVLRPCLRDGLRSDGFQLFQQFAGGALGNQEETYRSFLERVFDEIAQDLPALFDRREPRSLIFPAARCLERVVVVLTDPELGRVWEDDETIGWVYQDFHSAAERREIRRGSDVPRNSVELAIRNQLFTPRWVVEFLTDNTLGALWVEMTQGASAIADRCPYLLKSPSHPVGEDRGGGDSNPLSPPSLTKDPRELRVLDPACGSGHFLLYAFDLLEYIYREAWERRIGTSPGRPPLWVEYPDQDAYHRAIPVLILRHNLFGTDIDPRPIQVAALALWLRAQRAWQGIPVAERPPITRMNLVCAEPMPGDRAQIESFAATLHPLALGDLVREVWTAMRPVGEMGLLLRIEERIRTLIRTARERWEGDNGSETPLQGDLFDAPPNWSGRRHELSGLARDEAARFWTQAEGRVVQALADYAARAGDDERVLRRLFAEDAERGLAFIDLSRARYDVVLMNPPFGQPAERSKDALDADYPACGHEIYAMFFQRTLELLEPHGRVGAITNRTWLSIKWLRELRENIFPQLGAVTIGADLGSFVLEAQVETCAVVADRRAGPDTHATWVRLLKTRRKDILLYEALRAANEERQHSYLFTSSAERFQRLPEFVYAYWMSDALLERYTDSPTVQAAVGEAKQGTATASDFRFLRLAWEIDSGSIGLDAKWPRFAKGGEYRPFWDDVHLMLNWRNEGAEVKALGRGRPQNTQYFGRSGVTWPNRTTKAFGPRALPVGCCFGHMGPTAFPSDAADTGILLGFLTSSAARLLLMVRLAAGDERPGSAAKHYEVGMINPLPWPQPDENQSFRLRDLTNRAIALVREDQIETDETGETCAAFAIPPVLLTGRTLPLAQAARRRVEAREDRFAELSDITAGIDRIVADAYGFTYRDRQLMDEELEPPVAAFPDPPAGPDKDLFRKAYLTKEALPGERLPGGLDAEVDVRVEHRRGRQTKSLRDEESLCRLFALPPRRLAALRRRLDLLREVDLRCAAADVVSWAVGIAFGRWDLRLLDHTDWIPDWPDPFGPLPRCPLGQLVDARGLPATPGHIASADWLAARTDATVLPACTFDADGTAWLCDPDGRRLVPAEIDSSGYPLEPAWDGLLQDDGLDDATPARHQGDLYRRMSQVLEWVYGAAHGEREAELANALGADSLLAWLRRPDGFFADHLGRYSKSRRQAPIYWPLSTASGGLTLWLYYPRFSGAMLAAGINRLRENEAQLQRNESALLAARRRDALSAEDQTRLDRLRTELTERAELRESIHTLVNQGLQPHLDDGAIVNAAPLARWFRHRPWRTAAEAVWGEVQRGEHDWSHLALWLRPTEVLGRCRTERDLAIAHGREDLYVQPPERPRARRGRQPDPQLPLDGGDGG